MIHPAGKPAKETRNRKAKRRNPLAPWVLRIGDSSHRSIRQEGREGAAGVHPERQAGRGVGVGRER